jgi:hypothetical protein
VREGKGRVDRHFHRKRRSIRGVDDGDFIII